MKLLWNESMTHTPRDSLMVRSPQISHDEQHYSAQWPAPDARRPLQTLLVPRGADRCHWRRAQQTGGYHNMAAGRCGPGHGRWKRVRCRESSCTSISEDLKSLSSLRIMALSRGVRRVHGLSARRSYSWACVTSTYSLKWITFRGRDDSQLVENMRSGRVHAY